MHKPKAQLCELHTLAHSSPMVTQQLHTSPLGQESEEINYDTIIQLTKFTDFWCKSEYCI